METVVLSFLVGIACLGVVACLCKGDFFLHWSGPCVCVYHMVIVDYPHGLVLGSWVTVQPKCNIFLQVSLDGTKTTVVFPIQHKTCQILLPELSLCLIIFFWSWIVGGQYFHPGEIGFNEAGVYGCPSSIGFNGFDKNIKLLHFVIVSYVISLEQFIETLIRLHYFTCPLKMSFNDTDNAPNELQVLYAILCVMGLIVPLGLFQISIEGRPTLVSEQ